MSDPLILADTAVTVDVKRVPRGRCQPDLSARTLAGYDLVIVAMPHEVAPGHFRDVLQFLDRGGALFLFQPCIESAEFAGQLAVNRNLFWQTDISVSKTSWGYMTNHEYKTVDSIVDDLVDIVSKNGCLLLNIGLKPDGTVPEPERQMLPNG
jgi:hypothetical protein